MRIFLSTGGGLFGNLRRIMTFGTGHCPGLFRIFLPGVAVRTGEIHMGIPKRLLRSRLGRDGKAQSHQT